MTPEEEEQLRQFTLGGSTAVNTDDALMGGLGLTGAAFASQTGRAPTPTPQGPLSPLAQKVAANDAARASNPRITGQNLPQNPSSPATGTRGGSSLPKQPSLNQASRAARMSASQAAARNPGLLRFLLGRAVAPVGYFTTGYGIGSALDNTFGISDKIADAIVGGSDQPAFTPEELSTSAPSSTPEELTSSAPSSSLLGPNVNYDLQSGTLTTRSPQRQGNVDQTQFNNLMLGQRPAVNADMTTAQGPVFAPSSSLLGEIAASVPTGVGSDRGSTLIVQDSPSGLPRLDLPAQEEQKSGFFDPGGFGYEYLGPRFGKNLGSLLGAQKYGTGRSTEGDITGRPLPKNTLPGQTATLGATGLEVLDAGGKLLGKGAEYLTGLNIVEGGPVSAPAAQPTVQQAAEQPTVQQAAEQPTVDALATDTQPDPAALQSLPAREADPIRSTFTLPSGEVVMERESGERFTPTSEQLKSFSSVMQDLGQPTVTGLGVGGEQGVIFGGGQPPMSVAETRSRLQERFGAPTISAIQALPAGQGLGLPTDAQGRMITPTPPLRVEPEVAQTPVDSDIIPAAAQPETAAPADRVSQLSPFEQASLERQRRIGGTGSFEGDSAAREARIAERERRPGETQAQRDTRIAQSRTQGAGAGALTMADAVDLAGGDRTLARTMVVRSRRGLDPMTGDLAKPEGGLTFEQKLAQDKFDFDVGKFNYEKSVEAEDQATAERKSRDAAKFAARDLLRQNQNVMRKAQRAGRNIGFSTTGAAGALFGIIPGTGAFDQKATVETLQADAAFSTLQQMRDASKTGGALGQVSERELDLLMSAVGNLSIGQSEEQFRNNLVEYINLRNDAMRNIYDAFEADYGTQAANEAFKVGSRQELESGSGGGAQKQGTTAETPSGRYSVSVITE